MNLFREPSHFIVLVVLLALLFGWKKLPDMARSLGRSMRIFKSEVSEMKNDGPRPSPAASDTVPGDVVPPAAGSADPTRSPDPTRATEPTRAAEPTRPAGPRDEPTG